jgi:AraC family transcriptional regulator
MKNFRVSSYEANSKMLAHSHDAHHFTVVLKGSYQEVIDGKTNRHGAGSMLFYPAGHVHSQRFGEAAAQGLVFGPPASCLDLLTEQRFRLDRAAHLEAGSVSHIAQRFLWEAAHEDPFTGVILDGLLLEFVGCFGRRQKEARHAMAPRWLLQVRELLQDESMTLWTNEALAQKAGRHPVHLAKAFRRHFGETIGQHQRRLRLQKAQMLLAQEHLSLIDITFECGFTNQAHFSRSFKAAFGTNPSEYRLHARRTLART